jgi:hypothetical protein
MGTTASVSGAGCYHHTISLDCPSSSSGAHLGCPSVMGLGKNGDGSGVLGETSGGLILYVTLQPVT